MKNFSFSFYKKIIYLLLIFGFTGCVIPIPEQTYWSNPTSEEYDIFDEVTANIKTYQQKIATQNNNFLNTLEQNSITDPVKKEWFEKAKKAVQLEQDLTDEIERVWKRIVIRSGGTDTEGHPLGADQKITAQRLLFEDGKAAFLQEKINETNAAWLELIPEIDSKKVSSNFSNIFSNKNWVVEKTTNLRIGILQLAFAQLLFEIQETETKLLKYFWEKTGSPKIVAKKFEIISNPKSPFVIRGDVFESEIFLAPVYQAQNDSEMSIFLNGMKLPVKNGKVNFKERGSKLGDRNYKVVIKYRDPETGETISQNKEFTYAIGEKSMIVSADKMNVFYVGVDNPISISAAGVSSNDLKVSVAGAGANIKRAGGGRYILTASKPGECFINVSTDDGMKMKSNFRVKRIPDPKAKLGNSSGGAMSIGEFKAQAGVIAVLENFDFDARCRIQGFYFNHFSRRQDEVSVINKGGKYSAESIELISKAKPGDVYTFENVKARCPGDPAGRVINSMIFRIK